MLWVVKFNKILHSVGFGTRKKIKSVFLLLGFLLMRDTWKTLGLDRVNETRSSEGEFPLNSIFSVFLILSGHLSFPSLMSCQAEGFSASWWRARKTSAMKNMNGLISKH